MGDTLIADMRDYEDEDSFLRETSGPALSLALVSRFHRWMGH